MLWSRKNEKWRFLGSFVPFTGFLCVRWCSYSFLNQIASCGANLSVLVFRGVFCHSFWASVCMQIKALSTFFVGLAFGSGMPLSLLLVGYLKWLFRWVVVSRCESVSWLSLVVHSFTNVKKAGVHSVIRMVVGRSLDFFVRDSLVVLLFVFRSFGIRCSFIVRIGSFGSLAHSLFVHRSLSVRCELLVNWSGLFRMCKRV